MPEVYPVTYMSLINDTLKHFFLKEYAGIDPNKFVYLYQTGCKFEDSMFISPAPDENGNPFFSDAMACEFLSDKCDQILPVPGSENANTITSSLSDKYRSILAHMLCANTSLTSSFLSMKGRVSTKFDDINPFYIESALNTISYKPFNTSPINWYADNGWQDPPYTEVFSFKPLATPPQDIKMIATKPTWKQSPALSAFMLQAKPAFEAHAIMVKNQQVNKMMRPSLNEQHNASHKTIVTDHRKGALSMSPVFAMGQLLATQNHIISKPKNIITKPVEADSLTITFSYKILPITIPWIELELFGGIENYWYLPGVETGQLSTGENNISNKGAMPSYVSDIIIVKDVTISGHFSDNEIKQVNDAFGFEAFNLIDKQITGRQPNGSIKVEAKGKQILGFLCTVFPKCPAYSVQL